MANKKHAEDTASQNVLRAKDMPPTDKIHNRYGDLEKLA